MLFRVTNDKIDELAEHIRKLFIVLGLQHIERTADQVPPQHENRRGVHVSSIGRM